MRRGRRLALRLEAAQARFGLVVEPGLRQEYRDQPEQTGEGDHDDCTGAHVASTLIDASDFFVVRVEYWSLGSVELVKLGGVLGLC